MVKAALFFSRPHGAEPHPSSQPCFSKGWEAHWSHTHSHFALLSHFTGGEGEGSMPPSSYSPLHAQEEWPKEERCKTSTVSIKVSLHCQYIILFLQMCRTRQCTTDGWTTAFPGTYTAFYPTSTLHTEKTSQQTEREKDKNTLNTSVFCVPSDSLLRREVFRTVHPLQIYNFTAGPASFINTNCCSELNKSTINLSSPPVWEHNILTSFF